MTKSEIKTKFGLLIALLAMVGYLLPSCTEKDLYEGGEDNEAPSLLDFSTSTAVKLVIDYEAPLGFAAPFNVYAENPYTNENGYNTLRTDIKPIAGGLVVSGRYELSKDLPAYATDLYVHSPSLFAPTLMHAYVEGGVAMFKTVEPEFAEVDDEAPDTRSWRADLPNFYLGRYGNRLDVSTKHRPNYIDATKTITIDSEIMQKIEEAFPTGKAPKGDYAGNASIHLKEKAEVWISVVMSDGEFNNSLSYFCYDGPVEDLATLSTAEKEKLKEIVAFPVAKINSKDSRFALKAGEYVQLMYYNSKTGKLEAEFPAGTSIGWMLRAKGYNMTKKSMVTNLISDKDNLTNIYYSVPEWNPDPKAENRNYTIIFNAGTETEPFFCFGFEDWYNSQGSGDADCNDVMFNVIASPITAIYDPPKEIPEVKDVTTTDSRYGILAFEDYWPRKWDYDMNDVLVKYESTVTLLQKAGELSVYATEINDVFTLLYTGADFENKFSVKLDMNPNLVDAITVNGTATAPIADGSGFIIDLFENARALIEPYKDGSAPFEVNIKLKAPGILQSEFSCYAPYNPFVTPAPCKDVAEGTEVHLPMYPPTSRADMSLFGEKNDRSKPDEGIYYVSDPTNKYPFAINLSGVDKFKTEDSEGKAISLRYPDFMNWVESGLTEYKDWYVIP